MASLLVRRLARLTPEEDPVDGVSADLHIAINDFVEGLVDIIGGYHTAAQMKSFYGMTAPEETALDMLLAKINSAATTADKLGRVHRVRSILTKWERRSDLNLAAYDTPDDIETQLGQIDNNF